jgi:hypothetical protein
MPKCSKGEIMERPNVMEEVDLIGNIRIAIKAKRIRKRWRL